MKKIVTTITFCALALPFALFAEEGVNATVDVQTNVRVTPTNVMQEKRDAMMEKAQATRDELRANAELRREEIKNKMDEMRAQASSTRAEMRANMEAKRVELRAEFKARLETRVNEFLSKVKEHLTNIISRLDGIKGKIESRITKMEESGIDTAEAKAKLEIANNKIGEAEISIEALAGLTVSDEDPQGSIATIKTAVEEVKQAIRNAHQALVDVVNSLKPGLNKMDDSTSTDENI